MKILMRSNNSKDWQFAEPVSVKAEADLQELLMESPSLIIVDEIREGVSPLVVAIPEFGLPGSGRTDLLAFSANGDTAIIECKLAANPESKRKVIGQILEYAAYLWGRKYDEVNGRVQRLKEKDLAELVEEAVAGEWDPVSFRAATEQTLESGAFILIIVVDEINEELRRIIRYVNECSQSAFSLHALEMRRFRGDRAEVLVPHLYGVSRKRPSVESRRRKWTEEEFFHALDESGASDVANIVRDVYEWSERLSHRIWFGTGAEIESFTFHYLKEGKTISVFSVFTDGRLTLNYGWLSPQIDEKVMTEFHDKISQIETFKHIPAEFSKWHTLEVADAFKGPEELDAFKEAVSWLREAVSSS